MKYKFLVLAAATVLLGSVSKAQSFHLGVKGGANIFKVDGKSFKDEFRFGYNVGGFAEINFTKFFGIQPEVMWSQTNFRTADKFSEIYPGGVDDVKGKLNYLTIPILLSFRPVPLISFQAGPQFGILLNKEKSLVNNGKDAFKSGDFALLGGAQLNLGTVKVGGRYVIGLSDINDINSQDKWKNQGFQLYVGLKIL